MMAFYFEGGIDVKLNLLFVEKNCKYASSKQTFDCCFNSLFQSVHF